MSGSSPGASDKQARVQSPSYPSMSLDEAVAKIAKIDTRYRSSAVERLDVARLLGYTGASGPSNMALASLSAYGLLERAGKGEVRVTERARTILHFDTPNELTNALREAAYTPTLYRELRERFPDLAVPPEESVISFLNRRGFNTAAVRPAARAFIQTMRYLEKNGVSESSGTSSAERQSSTSQQREEMTSMDTGLQAPSTTMPPPAFMPAPFDDLVLNEPSLSIRSGTVRVEALLDYDGLSELENQIKALRMILKPKRSNESGRQSDLGFGESDAN